MALINWILGVFFALSGLIFIGDSVFFSLSCFLLAALLIPPLYQCLITKFNINFSPKLRYVIALLLFIIAVQAYPQSKTNQSGKSNIGSENRKVSPAQINSSEVSIKVTPTNTPSPSKEPTLTPSPQPTNTPIPTIFYPTWTPIPIQPTEPVQTNLTPQNSTSFACNCSKTCDEMASCDEAYYQLNTCGCTRRDGDHDGIPCETICP